jgi:hypothetical protein
MKFRIPKQFIYEFAEKLLKEAGVEEDMIEADLESFVYEAGERNWEEGEYYYYIEDDED